MKIDGRSGAKSGDHTQPAADPFFGKIRSRFAPGSKRAISMPARASGGRQMSKSSSPSYSSSTDPSAPLSASASASASASDIRCPSRPPARLAAVPWAKSCASVPATCTHSAGPLDQLVPGRIRYRVAHDVRAALPRNGAKAGWPTNAWTPYVEAIPTTAIATTRDPERPTGWPSP